MSMVVSYKKQVALGIMLLIILLGTVEAFANIWLYNFYTCEFENNEMFRNADSETSRKLCLESIGYDFTTESISWINGTRPAEWLGGLDENIVYLNSEGFRSPEFSKEKPNDTYRVFILGGSTSFGSGVLDNQTFPYYLQTMYNNANLNFNVEIINTGWMSYSSIEETKMIKDRLLVFEPDLFIVYDGWNDLLDELSKDKENSATLWKERWLEICDLGKKYKYDTIISLQPMVNTGKKILTEQEMENFIKSEKRKITVPYPQYVQKLEELKNQCSLTVDLRSLFDDVQEPIFYDVGHTGPRGNQIIAEKFFQISSPIILNETKDIGHVENELEYPTIEIHEKSITNDITVILKEIVHSYKTPRVLPLIFNN